MEALDDDAAECLASLAASYEPGQKPDAFFSDMVRMLSDMTADEIHALRQMVYPPR